MLHCLFLKDTATTEIYTLSLHDALPIWFSAGIPAAAAGSVRDHAAGPPRVGAAAQLARIRVDEDGLGAAEVQVVIGANVDAGVAHGGQLLPHRLGNAGFHFGAVAGREAVRPRRVNGLL